MDYSFVVGIIFGIPMLGLFMALAKVAEDIDRRNYEERTGKTLFHASLQDNHVSPKEVFKALNEADIEICFLRNNKSNS